MLAFEHSLDKPEEEALAKSMMTFMVRGLVLSPQISLCSLPLCEGVWGLAFSAILGGCISIGADGAEGK